MCHLRNLETVRNVGAADLPVNFNYWIFLPLSTIPIAYLQIKMLYNLKGMQLNKTLELSAKYAALFGLLFSAGMVL
ncbi:MAG: hypothetical protein P8X73_07460 [Ignavibacteriaceae bacterium]